jgi:UDP-glucose 4-epimerase
MVYGDGQQMRDLLYVDDVVDALIRSAMCPSAIGEIINLGSPPITLLDLAMLMIEVNGVGSYQVAPFPVMRKQIDIGSYYGDYAKATKVINWTPTKALVGGIKATLDYYREFQDEYL